MIAKNSSTVDFLSHPLFDRQRLQVGVLRLDLLHPVISGNKAMKLNLYLQSAKNLQKKGLITVGGPWSNHVHAAAYAAMKAQLPFTAIIKAREGKMTPTLEDVESWGGEILYVSTEDSQTALADKISNERNYFLVEMGGEGEAGVNGVAEFFGSLELPQFDYIICPVGTGTTLRGIAKSGLVFKNLVGANPGINDHYKSLLTDLIIQSPTRKFEIWEDKALKKFGHFPEWLPNKMNEWYERWNLPTDIVYTAKMLSMFMDKVEAGYFRENESILLIHTGGLQGNRSLPKDILNF